MRSYHYYAALFMSLCLEADGVGTAVRGLLDWQGTAAELLTKITPEGPRPRDRPANPRALVARLKRLVPALGQVRTKIVFHTERSNRGRVIEKRNLQSQPSYASQPSPADGKVSDGRVMVEDSGDGGTSLSTAAFNSANDGCDDSDGISAPLSSEVF
jgi:hypothetical protein